MKQAIYILAIVSGMWGCNGDPSTKDVPADSSRQVQVDTTAPIADTIKRFTVDDYPVTDEMLDDTTSNDASHPRQSGYIHSSDQVWFTNNTLNQSLVFELYTDKHRSATFHFYNKDLPKSLIERIELYTEDGDLASLSQKEKSFTGFINSATVIDKKYFTTNKGFRLGDSKQKALSIYGAPDERKMDGKFEVLEWDFVGDILYDGSAALKGKPLAKDNYGHQAIMFFRNNKLTAIILHNDIP
jgi:hypothetical protein